MFDSTLFIKTFLAKAQSIDSKTYYDAAPYPITEAQASTLPHSVVSAFRFTSENDNDIGFSTTIDIWAKDEADQFALVETKAKAMQALDNACLAMSGAYATIFFDSQQPSQDAEIELLCTRLSFSGRIFNL